MIERAINSWALATVTLVCAALIVSGPDCSPVAVILGILFLHGWVYWTHRLLHILPPSNLNTHIRFHHELAGDKSIPRWLELTFETITDLAMILSFGLVQWATGIHLFPTSCIVLFAIAYSSVHLVNYSIIGSVDHRRHHLTMNKNFGPDTVDHLFGTNYDDTFEDWDVLSLNAVTAFYITQLLKYHIGWNE
jgi:sterol desaturase/sphingolipid hydroxylase (fatty acid hydroxylase superfamily)